jgi:hypothetical protein
VIVHVAEARTQARVLQRMGLRTVPLASLRTGAASDTKSDPLSETSG